MFFGNIFSILGKGTLFQVTCMPSNKSDKVKKNQKIPVIYLLDDPNVNPLHCTDVFKGVAAFFCYNCPSMNGIIGTCQHLAFLFEALSAPYTLSKNVNKPVRLVNMKNKYHFQHPDEALQHVRKTVDYPFNVPRTSHDRRKKDIFWHAGQVFNEVDLCQFDSILETNDEDDMSDESSSHSGSSILQMQPANDSQSMSEVNLVRQTHDIAHTASQLQTANGTQSMSEVNPVRQTRDIAHTSSQSQTTSEAYHTTQSSQECPFGGFGLSTCNIQKFIDKRTKRKPGWKIPEATDNSGRKLLTCSHC